MEKMVVDKTWDKRSVSCLVLCDGIVVYSSTAVRPTIEVSNSQYSFISDKNSAIAVVFTDKPINKNGDSVIPATSWN